jgi:hypothetical protein
VIPFKIGDGDWRYGCGEEIDMVKEMYMEMMGDGDS